jgi:hypothetical protein
MPRLFEITSQSIERSAVGTYAANSAHGAVRQHLAVNHQGYSYTNSLVVSAPNILRGEAYSQSHGLVFWIKETYK